MESKDITFVVQGPVDRAISPLTGKPVTQTCLENIRRHHPGARTILSTWKQTSVEGLSFDEVVFSDDPGTYNCAPPDSGKVWPDNLNRQIVSSKNGLKLVTTKYAVKLRTDLIFLGNNWMKHFDAYPLRSTGL